MIGLHSFKTFLSRLKGKSIAILTHTSADVDAIASASMLYFSLSPKISAKIVIPDHLGANAKKLAGSYKIPFSVNSNLKEFDALIIVDLNSFAMLAALEAQVKEFKKPVFLIDHHNPSGQKIASSKLSLIQKNAVSTTEIIFELFKQCSIPLTKKTAALAACGIIADSAGFTVADHYTFSIMAEAMKKSSLSYSELLARFSTQEDFSEKIASLKAAKRLEVYGSGQFVLASTQVGSFEASAATALARIGADACFAGNPEKGIKISARANNYFLRKTGIDLCKHVLKPLAAEFSGDAGGHPGAAAYSAGSGNISQLLERCVQLTHEFLKQKGFSKKLKKYS